MDLNNYSDLKITEQISDTLDNAVVSILAKEKISYNKFELVEYNNTKWALFNIDYDITNVGVVNTISLIEPTKILENYIKVGMAFTDYTDLKTEIERALIKFEFPYTLLDSDGLLDGVSGIDLKYASNITLREVLDDMLSVIDCAVRFDGTNILIENNNKRGKLITLDNNIEINDSIDAEYDVGGIIAIGNNIFSQKNLIEYLVPRSESGVYDNTNGSLYTQFPISTINKIYLQTKFRATGKKNGNEDLVYDGDIVVDVTDFCYEYAMWSLLPTNPNTVTKDTLETTFYYNLKGNSIDGLFSLSRPNGFAPSIEVWRNIFILLRTESPYKEDLAEQVNNIITNSGITNFEVNNIILGYDSQPNYAIVDYNPIYNALIDTRKKQNDNTRIIMNYNFEQTNLELFSKNVQATADKMGNREITINMRHNNVSEMFNLHDYTSDNYVVNMRSYAFKNGYILAQYHLTQNFNNIAENIKILREKRLYNIPDDDIERVIEIKVDYKVSKTEHTYTRADDVLNNMLKTFNNESAELIKNLYLTTDAISNGGNIPVVVYSSQDAIYYYGKCYDNYAINYYVDDDNITKPFSYVDNNGECENYKIELNSDFVDNFKNNLDRVKKLPKTYAGDYNTIFIFTGYETIYKDKYETLSFLIRFGIDSVDDDLVIGGGFFADNKLLEKGNLTFKIKYGDFWIKSKNSAYSENTSDISIAINDTSITITGIDNTFNYYEIVDNFGNLILRSSTSNNKFYFYK